MVMRMKSLLCMMMMVAALATVAQADVYIVGRWATGPMETFLNANFSPEELGTIHKGRYNGGAPAATADDVVIFLRETTSGDYDDGAAEVRAWNDIPAPMLMMAPHTTRKQKLGWATNDDTLSTSGAGAETLVLSPSDPLFAGVTITDGYADLITEGIDFASATSFASGTTLAEGLAGTTPTATITRLAKGSGWASSDEGGISGTHGGARLVFYTPENRQTGLDSGYLTADGLTVLKNCVQELLDDKYKPVVDAGIDQETFASTIPILGTVTDPTTDPNFLTYLWTADDAGVSFGDDEDPNTTATFDDFGVYKVTLTATNTLGLSSSDSLTVLVIDPGDASTPDPADGATGVVQSPTLSWTAGADSASSDVWFGKTAETMELVSDDQTETSYVVPGTLIKGQTYYWVVDETDNSAGIHEGTVWSYTVEALGGTTNWVGGVDPNNPSDNLWSNEANWDIGVPGVGTAVNIRVNGPALIDSTVEAVATGNWIRMGITDAVTDPNLVPTVLNMTGGTLTTKAMAVGNGGPAIINLSGGTITVNGNLNWSDSYNESSRVFGKSTLNMSGGIINITGQLSLLDRNDDNSMILTGGVINMANIRLYSAEGRTQKIDLAGGIMVLAGDQTAECIGMIDHPVMTGFISYGGAGSVMVSYDEVADETTVAGCPWNLTADFSGDCVVNGDDLELMVADWLFTTPASVGWSFDMTTDPVGTGELDLVARDGIASYVMGDDTGTGTLELTGATTLDQQFAGTSGLFDTDLHLVIKSTNDFAVDFWFYMATSATVGQTNVGFSTMLESVVNTNDPNIVSSVQTVEFWTDGISRQQAGYEPFIETDLDPNNYLIIDVNYDYDTDTYAYTIDDGTNPVRSGSYAYAQTSGGDGGFYTI